VKNSALVTPLANEPAVVQGWQHSRLTRLQGAPPNGEWLDVSVPWYQDETRWSVPLAQSGPRSWPRVQVRRTPSVDRTVGAGVTVNTPLRLPVHDTRVTNIRTDDDRISFDVDRPGAPVLVKVSYFPNWKASGAQGPWRVTPNFMVVIPTSRHVELHYGRAPVDVLGWLLTLLGLGAVVLLWRAGPVPVPPEEPPRPGDPQLAFDFEHVEDDDGHSPWARPPPDAEPGPRPEPDVEPRPEPSVPARVRVSRAQPRDVVDPTP
jgi:hypothetical protein